ncbi:glucose-1-phosphate thymidylyltransferase RfbA [Litoreibacter albidus]|uniref:Glucose-1-phosphate thymidylyltransferase n=1 Tax=Litoreibacter albidus TaxID=670155 RepID=A0A1H3CSF7_9RHOB|nr:glucose-1-phosphate thymidylyltransferase RfbA [Litoreibacter albidus]SDX57172.1 Glucose-1-phosphate thymidylyltransferase [Litoreibacter albidus]
MTRTPKRKGIILAGGSGTRLYPITVSVSKQLLPVYNKPMIYYPLSVLMLAGIRDILIITTPQDADQFKRALGDGSQWGVSLSYVTQPAPDGLAQAYVLAEDFLNGAASAMVLGDNIFFGHGLPDILARANAQAWGGTVFGYRVSDPERYGVVDFDDNGRAQQIIEKPRVPPSNYAVTGLYFLDGTAPERAKSVTPSARGELEITALLEMYLHDGLLNVQRMGRGYAWLDTGTHASLLDAGNFVRTLETRQGLQTGSPDEIAFTQGWINAACLRRRATLFAKNEYGDYLESLLQAEPCDTELHAKSRNHDFRPPSGTISDKLLRQISVGEKHSNVT